MGMSEMRPRGSGDWRRHWTLDPDITFLNHGSFGACPVAVLDAQAELRRRIEREPVRFFVRELEDLLDDARDALATFVGADARDVVFVPNATTGVNAVLRSMQFEPGDELLTTDHEYNACRNAITYVAERARARVVVVEIPFPLDSPDRVLELVTERVGPRTRIALIDHITSQTGLIFPIRRLVDELAARGVDTLVDGAHAPGMVDLDVRAIGAAYYTGNCHKWVCAPKGAAFLHVRRDRQGEVRPLVISHGANSSRTDRSRFLLEFGWMGTDDPTAHLCVPEAIRVMGSLLPGGWTELRTRNRNLALHARRTLCEALGIALPAPDEMIGSLVAVTLPDGSPEPPLSPLYTDPIQDVLLEEHRIEVPVIPWPAPPRRVLRVSAQLYNEPREYERLATALTAALQRE
jgi:isopenicillin-N epimerase